MDDSLAHRIATHVNALCAARPDRSIGSPGNRDAVSYIENACRARRLDVESIPFSAIGWRAGASSTTVDDVHVPLHAGPYSLPYSGSSVLLSVTSLEDLQRLGSARTTGAVLLVHGPIASGQLTPRVYPWYSNPHHAEILDAIEATSPACLIAATDKDPATTAALSPFPLIEDAAVQIPSAYLHEGEARVLLDHLGGHVDVQIDSDRFDTRATQPVARLRGDGTGRILVTSHLDTKPGTPGALDNASGVATMLAVAELLVTAQAPRLQHTIEFVAFNGEDNCASPGEVAYLEAYPHVADVSLVINVDGAGYRAGPTAVSRYGVSEQAEAALVSALSSCERVVPGDEWWAGDHAIFAMRGVPALALTSRDSATIAREIAHTAADVPSLVDPHLLAEAAEFIVRTVTGLEAHAAQT